MSRFGKIVGFLWTLPAIPDERNDQIRIAALQPRRRAGRRPRYYSGSWGPGTIGAKTICTSKPKKDIPTISVRSRIYLVKDALIAGGKNRGNSA